MSSVRARTVNTTHKEHTMPDVIPMQPVPVRAMVRNKSVEGNIVAAIYREWKPGDTLRCRLCDHCSAANGSCIRVVNEFVSTQDAPLFHDHAGPNDHGGSRRRGDDGA